MFDAHCRAGDYQASLRLFPRQVPHRDRVRRAISNGDPDSLITGVPVVSIGGLPTDRPLQVTATPAGDWPHHRSVTVRSGGLSALVAATDPRFAAGVATFAVGARRW